MCIKKRQVNLTPEDRSHLESIVNTGRSAARTQIRARILLLSDMEWRDNDIEQVLNISSTMTTKTRQRYVEEGVESALVDRPRPGQKKKLTEQQCAHIIAVACSAPPEGHAHWTLRLLADKVVELRFAESFSYESVRTLLKKNTLKPWQHQEWCIAEVGSDYVAAMEDVLEQYELPYDPERPVVCFDESPEQLMADVRKPLPAQPNSLEKTDTEYKRNGVLDLMMICEPKRGTRDVLIMEHRTKIDFAHCMKHIVDSYPDAKKICVIQDNLNTHKIASLYEAFQPEEACAIARKLEFHYTPKHGSWLNIAEIELAALSNACLSRRIPDKATLKREIEANILERNKKAEPIKWKFTSQIARRKLAHLYPTVPA